MDSIRELRKALDHKIAATKLISKAIPVIHSKDPRRELVMVTLMELIQIAQDFDFIVEELTKRNKQLEVQLNVLTALSTPKKERKFEYQRYANDF
jgi:hypothetical protein